MRNLDPRFQRIWASGDYEGDDRPMQRATVAMHKVGHYRTTKGRWASVQWNQAPFWMPDSYPRELPNIRSIEIDRTVNQPVATCVIVMDNVAPREMVGTAGRSQQMDSYDLPGWYTPNRGTTERSTDWNMLANRWKHVLLPNRIIKTYWGYGHTPSLTPDRDPKQVISGVWMIDSVQMNAITKTITINCRDVGKMLVEQLCFPPVIPLPHYPREFESFYTVPGATTRELAPITFRDASSSYGGHPGSHTVDASLSTYWASAGGNFSHPRHEWLQFNCPGSRMNGIRIHTRWGNYQVRISVMSGNSWVDVGGGTTPDGIPYIKSGGLSYEEETTIMFGKEISNVTRVRLTFDYAYYAEPGENLPYHFGVRRVQALRNKYAAPIKRGNYGDYTDIVKYFCAVGGFYWPANSEDYRGKDAHDPPYNPHEPDPRYWEKVPYQPAENDPVLSTGRIWGDLEQTGTSGPDPINAGTFDKKPLMDAITYVKDIVGFHFFIDETGGVQFRSPNIWQIGSYESGGPAPGYKKGKVLILDEKQVLRELVVTINDQNQRSSVFIGNLGGDVGAVANGFEQNPMGLERVAVWTDQHFGTKEECQMMADLIGLRIIFSYRTDTITIPGTPVLQLDDQVRVYERHTGESYIHYVQGINSTWNSESGEWTMTLATHWLGERPFEKWAFNPWYLSPTTQEFLKALGKI